MAWMLPVPTVTVKERRSEGSDAERLGVSVAAVKLRLHGAFNKLNVRSRAQLIVLLRPS